MAKMPITLKSSKSLPRRTRSADLELLGMLNLIKAGHHVSPEHKVHLPLPLPPQHAKLLRDPPVRNFDP